MKDALYDKFVEQWKETTDLPTQTVGPLTPYYKMVTKRLKVMPLPILLSIGLLLVVLLYFLIGPSISPITSFLQRGF